MTAASGVFLLAEPVYHAVLGIVSHFLGRPFPFGRLFEVVAPGLAANRGALQHSVRGVSFGLITCPFPFALCAHVLAPTCASWFVAAGAKQAKAGHYGK